MKVGKEEKRTKAMTRQTEKRTKPVPRAAAAYGRQLKIILNILFNSMPVDKGNQALGPVNMALYRTCRKLVILPRVKVVPRATSDSV